MCGGSGLFVVFEGIDGSGTTTHGDLLAEALRARGRTVRRTAEPSHGPVGNLLRAALRGQWSRDPTPETVAALFAADRLDHLAAEIAPWRAAGMDVICDRYVASSYAYQGAECDPDWVLALNRYAAPADATVFLDVPVEVAIERIDLRGKRRERFETERMLAAVRQRYLDLLAAPSALFGRVVRLDSSRDREEVARGVLAALDDMLTACA